MTIAVFSDTHSSLTAEFMETGIGPILSKCQARAVQDLTMQRIKKSRIIEDLE